MKGGGGGGGGGARAPSAPPLDPPLCIWLGKANQALLSRSIYPQCTQVNPMYGHQKSLLNMCVCMCVCAEIIYMISGVCVRVKSQSQCGFYLQVYWIWLKANQALLSRSIYPQCTQVMYGHSLLNNSTCVCVHMRVCMYGGPVGRGYEQRFESKIEYEQRSESKIAYGPRAKLRTVQEQNCVRSESKIAYGSCKETKPRTNAPTYTIARTRQKDSNQSTTHALVKSIQNYTIVLTFVPLFFFSYFALGSCRYLSYGRAGGLRFLLGLEDTRPPTEVSPFPVLS